MIPFSKAHAYGNDFLYVLESDVSGALLDALAREMCNRHTGVGADGLIVFRPSPSGAAMRLFNADGSRAEVSGNGVRVLAALLARGREEGQLEEVALAARRVGLGVRLGLVPGRVHVLAAGEHDAVHSVQRTGRERRPHQWTEHDRDAAGRQHRSDISRVEPGPLGAVPLPHDTAERDARSAHLRTESGKGGGQLGSVNEAGSACTPIKGTEDPPSDTSPSRGAPGIGLPS